MGGPRVRLWALLLCLAGCSESVPGRRLAEGLGRDLKVAPGGQAAAFLTDAVHPDDRAVPQDLVLGALWLARLPEQGPAEAARVGSGVPNAASAVAFSDDGALLAFFADWHFRSGEGQLWVAAPGRAPLRLAARASAFRFAPRGAALAWVADGTLWVKPEPSGGAEARALQAGVQSFAWSPDGTQLAARAPAAAGGKLWLVPVQGGAAREVAAATSDFLFGPDGSLGLLGPAGPKGGDRAFSLLAPGAGSTLALGEATSFGFAPDAKELLLLSTDGTLGDAFGRLLRQAPTPGMRPEPLGERVSEWRAAADGALVLLAGYDVRSRSGQLLYAPRGAGPRELARRVQSFQVSPRGERIFYVVEVPQKGDFKVELWTAPLPPPAGDSGRRLDEGVYGFATSPDGGLLYWKSRCQGARSCVLFRARADGAEAPVQLATRVAGFDLSADGRRLLVSHPHKGAPRAVDLSLVDALGPPVAEPQKPFIEEVEPVSRFLDGAGRRILAPRLTAHQPGVQLVERP